MIQNILEKHNETFIRVSGFSDQDMFVPLVWEGTVVLDWENDPEGFVRSVKEIHDFLLGRYGGVSGELRSLDSLLSGLPYVSEGEIPFFLFETLYFGHFFRDGNKRIALMMLLLFRPELEVSDAVQSFGDEVIPGVEHLTTTERTERKSFIRKIFLDR